jgi:transcription elongation factor GreA
VANRGYIDWKERFRTGPGKDRAAEGEKALEKLPMTKEGFSKLKEELDRLKRVERPQALQAMNEAAAHGDISDNADYRVAKERRDFIEGRIKELDDKLARAQIIETRDLVTDKVVFGCTVLLGDEADRQVKYKIVGADETDIPAGRISINSPVAKALIGHRLGEVVQVKVPSGMKEYQILEILSD